MFDRAHHLVISGGTFYAGVSPTERSTGLNLLHTKIAAGAFHNSAERYDAPKCHPRTRESILKKIMDWIQDDGKLCSFLWLYGPAGAGKSAIAQSIAEMCFTAGLLAASFFFSRTAAERNNGTLLIPTLAYQLTLAIPEIASEVGKALEIDPMIFSKSLETQINALIIQPLKRLSGPSSPIFVILDGLDECGESRTQRYILDVIFAAVKEIPVPLFFLIASRPETHIRDTFNEERFHSMTMRIVLDDSYKPEVDLRLLLESRFQDVRAKHPAIPSTWPSALDLELLVQKSSGQFIYISTVMKYLDTYQYWPPDRLNIIFGLSTAGDETPFAELDAFYHHILSSVVNIDEVLEVFIFLLLVQSWVKTKGLVGDFFFFRPGMIDLLMNDLHSLIDVPSSDNPSAELRMFHASFPDFLFDRARAGRFFIDTRTASNKLTSYCMKHFQRPNRMLTDGLNLHHMRSVFTLHCVNSQPIPWLVRDLYDFDMLTHLEFWTPDSEDNVVGMYQHDVKRIMNLIIWLQNKKDPGRQEDLFRHHLSAVDNWLFSQLDGYPRGFCLHQVLAVGTLTNFLSQELFSVLGPTSVDSNSQKFRRSDRLQIYTPKAESSAFYTILNEFLTDNERSGSYFVDGRSFAVASILFLVFLLEDTNSLKSIRSMRFALDLLPEMLSKSTMTPELTKVLRNHPLKNVNKEDVLFSEKRRVSEVIKKLLKECLLPDNSDLYLLIAYTKWKDETAHVRPGQSYMAWIHKDHHLDDHRQQGFDVLIR